MVHRQQAAPVESKLPGFGCLPAGLQPEVPGTARPKLVQLPQLYTAGLQQMCHELMNPKVVAHQLLHPQPLNRLVHHQLMIPKVLVHPRLRLLILVTRHGRQWTRTSSETC